MHIVSYYLHLRFCTSWWIDQKGTLKISLLSIYMNHQGHHDHIWTTFIVLDEVLIHGVSFRWTWENFLRKHHDIIPRHNGKWKTHEHGDHPLYCVTIRNFQHRRSGTHIKNSREDDIYSRVRCEKYRNIENRNVRNARIMIKLKEYVGYIKTTKHYECKNTRKITLKKCESIISKKSQLCYLTRTRSKENIYEKNSTSLIWKDEKSANTNENVGTVNFKRIP